jgi:hypothetical protein
MFVPLFDRDACYCWSKGGNKGLIINEGLTCDLGKRSHEERQEGERSD